MPSNLTNFINNEFVEPASGKYLDNVNPSTTEVNNYVPDSDKRDATQAINAARKAFKSWKLLTRKERAEYLYKIVALMESKEYKQRLIMADVHDMGKPVTNMTAIDFEVGVGYFKTYAQLATNLVTPFYETKESNVFERCEPLGIVGLISPWNFPLMIFCGKVAPAIVMGNTCVCKPTELSPTSAMIMCEIFQKVLPKGVVNVVNGYGHKVGEPICTSKYISAISFTGGSATGMRISSVAAPKLKKLQLELGGKNPAVIFDDCYLDECVDGMLTATWFNTGQVCVSGKRVYVQESLLEKFLDKFKQRTLETYKQFLGDPTKPTTVMGPLVSKQHYKKVTSYLQLAQQEGGTIIQGGKFGDVLGLSGKLRNGYFVEPTIVMGLDQDCRCLKEEIFGPICFVSTFKTEEEAIKLANDTTYGLAACVWTRDVRRLDRMQKAIEAGTVWGNCYFGGSELAAFGGYKNSGVGREGGMHSLRFFTEVKSIVSKL